MNFLNLFVVALMPVLKTLLISAIGLFLALDRVNILGAVARHHLNNLGLIQNFGFLIRSLHDCEQLVFYVFSPALIVSNLSSTIKATNIVSLWFMPLNILLTFIIGSALGWILVKITKTPKHFHGLVIGCCSAGNLGNLLLIIIPAVCEEKNSPFGDSSTCSTNGQAYTSLSMATGSIYIWSYVYNIMRVSQSKSNEEVNINGSSSIIGMKSQSPRQTSESFTQALPSNDCPRSRDTEAQAQLPPIESDDKVLIFNKIKKDVKIFVEKINLKMLFAPSTIASIVGLLIGVITPIRKIMIGDNAPLRVLKSSASLLGEATIPSMTLIVGANLLTGLKRSGVGLWVVIGVNVVRYIALPLLGILVVKAAHHFGWVGSDSLYQFILLLQYALPSAMSIGTITQLFDIGQSECSVIMLWNYVVASLSLTLWSTYYMWIIIHKPNTNFGFHMLLCDSFLISCC
ncbi:hypothetical protein HYC85_005351 [Camellia sinensis]|uniref:Uncharacterized protein n=1 Tax=Camellia sinensis TaxID=4442 RepID=A0A7J7I119_CAMSI|nr:hypothetical protein HYC85_005351 [Camellia sinensis]